MAKDETQVNVLKELLFLHMSMDEDVVFYDVTGSFGQPSPFRKKVYGIVGVRISDEVIAFHSRGITKKVASRVLADPLNVPRRSLSRLENRAVELTTEMRGPEGSEKRRLTPNTLVANINGEERDFIFRVENGVLTVEPKNDDAPFEIVPRPMQVSLYFRSPNPKVDRMIAVHYSGFLNRRVGDMENGTRAVSLVINSLLGLKEFSALTGIVDVHTPRAPEAAPVAPKRSKKDRVQFPITVNFWDEYKKTTLGSKEVMFEVDLDHANQVTGNLLYHIVPDAELEPVMGIYKDVLMKAVTGAVEAYLSRDEQADLVTDIILGVLEETGKDRIRDSVEGLPDIDVTPALWEWAPESE